MHVNGIGDSDADGHEPRQHERVSPAARVDQNAGQERCGGHPEIAEHAVDRQRHAGLPAALHHHRQPYGVVDGRENADREEAGRDRERRIGQRRGDRARADPEKEDDHHPLAAPLVRDPSGRDGADAEGDESGRGERNERRVTHLPLRGQPERGDGREDQHEEMVEEVPDVEKQEADPVPWHGQRSPEGNGAHGRPRRPAGPEPGRAAGEGRMPVRSRRRGPMSAVGAASVSRAVPAERPPPWWGRAGRACGPRSPPAAPASPSP